MPIIANIIATYVNRFRSVLPACVRDIAVAWYKDLTNATITGIDPSDSLEYYAVDDAIGDRKDVVFFGQYLSSGTINFGTGRTGTFDYTDPSTGNLVTGVAMGTAVAVPANGICDIVTSDGSEYPCCERAGDVVFDVENGFHIRITTPVWAEALYGTDFLNQNGYADKASSDELLFAWTAEVLGSTVVLNDDCLIPLKKNDSLNPNSLDSPLNQTL
jgi:hypothetical protein